MCEFLRKVADFRISRCLPIEGIFWQTLYNSQLFVLINEIIKIFSISWRILAILAGYYLRGYFIAGQIQRFRFGI